MTALHSDYKFCIATRWCANVCPCVLVLRTISALWTVDEYQRWKQKHTLHVGELHFVKLQSSSTDNHPLQCHLRNRTSAQRNQSLFFHPSHRTRLHLVPTLANVSPIGWHHEAVPDVRNPSKLCRNEKTSHALQKRTPARQTEQSHRARQLKRRRKRGSATGRHAPLGTYTRSLPKRHSPNWRSHRRQELLSSASTRCSQTLVR